MLEIGRMKFFLSRTHLHKPNMYENIYFLFQKNTHTNKKIYTSKFIRTDLRFCLSSCFSTKKNAVRVDF